MKYVIAIVNGCETPILFPDYVEHSHFKNLNPISAGSVSIGSRKDASVFGKSVGLKLGNQGKSDVKLIEKFLRKE
jgi:hypothetical protein